MQESKQLSRQDTGPHTFQPSNANDNRKKWFQIQKVLLIATKSNVWFKLKKFLFILRTTPF